MIDLQLGKVQFCSGNHIKDGNVVFDSPLIIYSTGTHFQSCFQQNHEFFINFARQLEVEYLEIQPSYLASSVQSNNPTIRSHMNTSSVSRIQEDKKSMVGDQHIPLKRSKVSSKLVSNKSMPSSTLELKNRFICLSESEEEVDEPKEYLKELDKLKQIKSKLRTETQKKQYAILMERQRKEKRIMQQKLRRKTATPESKQKAN